MDVPNFTFNVSLSGWFELVMLVMTFLVVSVQKVSSTLAGCVDVVEEISSEPLFLPLIIHVAILCVLCFLVVPVLSVTFFSSIKVPSLVHQL